MKRKGKFNKGGSYKRPFFVSPMRDLDGKLLCGSGSSKELKHVTNRKLRHAPIDSISNGCAYKRLIEIYDFNGDSNTLHIYIPYVEEDEEVNHVIKKGSKFYFPK